MSGACQAKCTDRLGLPHPVTATCQQSQRAILILVQCGQMVSSSALDSSCMGGVTCQQIWDQFWQSQRAIIILVQCGQMVSSSALETTSLGSVTCQQMWDQFWQSQRADFHSCAVRTDGQLVCFGGNDVWAVWHVPADLGPVLAVSAGDFSYLCGADRCSARLLCRQ